MLKTLVGGAKTSIKKYFLFFEIFPKNMVFWASKSTPSVNIKLLSLQGESENQVNKKKETQGDPTS